MPENAAGPGSVRLEDARLVRGTTRFRFSAAIPHGATVSVIGPSGSGKSTLLDLVAGFVPPASGLVEIGGLSMAGIPPARRPVTMVFQENNLFAHLDVRANVTLGVSPSLKPDEQMREAVSDAIARVGLSGKEARLPSQLSGGERQRVAIARAIVRDRPVLLLDEPFAALGPALRSEMIDLVADVKEKSGMTLMLVTHSPDDVRRLGGELVFVDGGEIAAQGPVHDLLDGPHTPPRLKDYLGS